MANRRINSRATAAAIVGKWLKDGSFPDRILKPGVPDQPFVTEVVYGAVKWNRLLLWVVERCSDGKPQPAALPYLLVGLYQILLMDSVPPYAAVNETVEAAKNLSKRAAGYVNGMLRRALREKEEILKESAKLPVAVKQSHPDILVSRWTEKFGSDKTAALCEWNNSRAGAIIHPNPAKTNMDTMLAMLRKAGIEATPHPVNPAEFISIPHGFSVPELPGFSEGLFSAQDPSTAVAIAMLDPQPGDTILDACAAPGGKTILIAERMKGQGRIVAADVYDDRLALLQENMTRMGITIADAIKVDSSTRASALSLGENTFDRILLDVPCSNTGVLRRRPDARWRFNIKRLEKINGLQNLLIDNVSCLLKPGGVMVYSTCSIEPEEGEILLHNWLKKNSNFKLLKSVSLFPPEAGVDGIFAACLQKNG